MHLPINLHEVFLCSCGHEIIYQSREFSETCTNCGRPITVDGQSINFLRLNDSVVTDNIDKIKFTLKAFPGLYQRLIEILSPVFPWQHLKIKRALSHKLGKEATIFNIGSGSYDFFPNAINVDMFPYSNVNVICDISSLPIRSEVADAVVCLAVLEHVANPITVVDEIYRIMKIDSDLHVTIPFMQGFHASPNDFQRFTESGMKELFKEFEILSITAISPTGSLLWIFQEWLGLVLSFGSSRLARVITIFAMVLTWPLKYVDYFLERHPLSKNIASAFYVHAKKI